MSGMKGAKLANLGGRKAWDACASALAKRPHSLGRVRGGDGSVFGPQGKAAARASFCTKQAALQWLFALMFALAARAPSTLAEEWNCASTSGTFTRATDCTMGDEVAVSGDLTVTGNETVYSTLMAAIGKRHFKITSGAHTLRLKWLNMTGGDLCNSYNDACHGGSIHVKSVAAHLNISHCVFFNNSAYYGGAIYASGGPSNLFLSSVLFESNTAAHAGGVYFTGGTFHGEWNTFKKNAATVWDGGGFYIYSGSTVSLTDSTFGKNTAWRSGGGILIFGNPSSSTQVTLTRVQLIENSAGGSSSTGGGGLHIYRKATANIRECTFVHNDGRGQHIFTRKDTHGTPSLTIVNTNFTDLAGSHPFYGWYSVGSTHGTNEYITPSSCTANPCSVSPFTGSCKARTNAKHGVLCMLPYCPAGHHHDMTAYRRQMNVDFGPLAP